MWGDEYDNNETKQQKQVVLLDEHFVYTMGNEIHFTTGVNRTSIQALIKQIMDLIMEHKKKAMGEPDRLDIVLVIDSGGGAVNSALKFCDFLDMCREKFPFVKFTSVITGCAASAATIMSVYCDKRFIGPALRCSQPVALAVFIAQRRKTSRPICQSWRAHR